MPTIDPLQPLATFCGSCGCGCPQLYVDHSAPADQRIVLTDDFGSRVRMSTDQFADMVAQAKSGALDNIV
ncbi:MAG TPA: hypothetical protein VHH34_10190 [Pseudonocardiaceae bacterium]|nr:hypothetical protein [Pseudonocardiaceae bacterium]